VGELAYSANVFVAIRRGEAEVTAQVAADFVAIELVDAEPLSAKMRAKRSS
jgi:hypothetical protein